VGAGELGGPEEVRSLLEVGADGEDSVNEVFNRQDIACAEGLLDGDVGGRGNSPLVDLAITVLVDQFTDSFEIGFA